MNRYPHIIAVGGVGGSGTRIVARMLQLLDIYIGQSLNSKLDNLWFTLLFKRPAWFRASPGAYDLAVAIGLFQRAMEDGLWRNASAGEEELLRLLMAEIEKVDVDLGVTRTVLEDMLKSRPYDAHRFRGWGWKEPNTHIFLTQIAAAMPSLKYVHVVRNGLDMAFSRNQQQVLHWGSYVEIGSTPSQPPTPGATLDFWIAANRRAIQMGRQLRPGKFHVLNYDRLCADPDSELRAFLDFLEIDASTDDIARLAQIIVPMSLGRYRQHPRSTFTPAQLAAVAELGFPLDDPDRWQ